LTIRSTSDLENTLRRIDGRGYKAYKDLQGDYDLGLFTLHVDHAQADPYAPPSRIRVTLGLDRSGFRGESEAPGPRRRGLEDFLGRLLEDGARSRDSDRWGLRVDHHGQQILWRTVVNLGEEELEARMGAELPAAGRRILGSQARRLLLESLPQLVESCLLHSSIDLGALGRHQDVMEDYVALKDTLDSQGWVAFVANGSLLARRAGHDDRPLLPDSGATVVPWEAPEKLEAEVRLPHAGVIRGMPIPEGITLLVGGGFHGKSTLLSALALGVYPHIPGDGREHVVSLPSTVTIRAEDGRAVTGTDISPFIDGLPFGASTKAFTTQNASGSTSQAANIVEALEVGARLLLIDEDSSATNFMIRDEPMRRLLRPGQEPITPFLERVRDLHRSRGVSTVLVIGGSGEYFRVADRVILMDHYRPRDVTEEARGIISDIDEATGHAVSSETGSDIFAPKGERRLRLGRYGHGDRIKVKAVGTRRLVVDREEVDLESCDQLVSPAQVRTLAEFLTRILEGQRDLPDVSRGFHLSELVNAFMEVTKERGLDGISRFRRPDLAAVRLADVAAMVNRLRRLQQARG
jgi:predicted ABC-class ATPase